MNYIVVRTRLQALIVAELLASGEIRRPYCLIQTYQAYRGEDDSGVYAAYDDLARNADFVYEQALQNGFPRMFFDYIRWLCRARLSGGVFYMANLNRIPFALALKVVRGVKLRTFDDGSANVQNRSKSFRSEEQTIEASTMWRTVILRKILPKGAAFYVRKRIGQHYTIYPGLKNVVPDKKLFVVDLDWTRFLNSDASEKLPKIVETILLGVPYQGPEYESAMKITAALLERVDMFIPHPRDTILNKNVKSVPISAPAESIIDFYLKRGGVTVYHFNSSAVLPFSVDRRCQLIDLSERALSQPARRSANSAERVDGSHGTFG